MARSPEAGRPHAWALLLVALGAALPGLPCRADTGALEELLAGEFNNHEQVWQQGIDGVAPDPRRHWRFQRSAGARLELALGLGQAAPAPPAWTIVFRKTPHAIVAEVEGAAQCRYEWREKDSGFEARASQGRCPGLPSALAVDEEGLTSVWPTSRNPRVERARRVRYYTGWVALQRTRLDPEAGPDEYVFVREARWHDEGFVLPVRDGERPTGIAVELSRLTYQNTRTAVLKLGIVDEATGETLSYAWAEPGAGRIGINLGWIQAGLTRESDRPAENRSGTPLP